jgi:Bacteriophage lambda head decoration protein D
MTSNAAIGSRHSRSFILYEGSGGFSRDRIAVAPNQALVAGHVVGKVRREDGTEEVTLLQLKATDGSQIAAGIVIYPVTTDASPTDRAEVLIGHAEVNSSDLTWPAGMTAAQQKAAIKQLATTGIVVR